MAEPGYVSCTLKLRLRPAQERLLTRWLWHLTGVYNWAVRKIELDAASGIYHSRYDLEALVARHGAKLGIPSHTLERTVRTAHQAWQRCFKRLSRRPRMKSRRNRLNGIPLVGTFRRSPICRIFVPSLGPVRFHAQEIPAGTIKCGRLVKRMSGWYLCLVIAGEPSVVPVIGETEVGIDPGFRSLVVLSTGEKVDHPREIARTDSRIAQAQRGGRFRLTARLRERQGNQRRDRNHKLSHRLVSQNALIAWSKDSHRRLSDTFGKSVASAAHGQLREMLAYKCRSDGREFIEVSNRYSTVTCSACGARSGPTGYAGLSVRQWRCGCGAEHDRDVNAAVNTLLAGRGLRHERVGNGTSRNRRVSKMAMVMRPQERICAGESPHA